MRLLFIAGSPRRESVTRRLLRPAFDYAQRAHDAHEVDFLHLGEEAPEAFRGFDVEYPDDTRLVLDRVRAADALVIAAPVYNGSIPAALKNLFEFLDYKGLRGRVAGIVVSGGGERGMLQTRGHLVDILLYFGMHVTPTAVFARRDEVERTLPADVLDRLESLVDEVVQTQQALRSAEEPLTERVAQRN